MSVGISRSFAADYSAWRCVGVQRSLFGCPLFPLSVWVSHARPHRAVSVRQPPSPNSRRAALTAGAWRSASDRGRGQALLPTLTDFLCVGEDAFGGSDGTVEVVLGAFDLRGPGAFGYLPTAQHGWSLLAGGDAEGLEHRLRACVFRVFHKRVP